MKNRWIAVWVVVSVLAGPLHGATYHVDDNAPNDPAPFNHNVSDPDEDGSPEHPFDSIQEAIDVAEDGDTIVVAPGRYLSRDKWQYDELRFNGKNIRLVSSAPTDFDVTDQTVLCGVVIFDGTETGDCLLQGFKIQNYGHGGILGNGTLARISHCIISGNGPCGATVVMDVQGRISNCLIVDNTTFHDCGVLPVVSGCAEFVNCTIANNLSGVGLLADKPIVRNCIIHANQGPPTGGPPVHRTSPLPPISYSVIENWTGSTSYNGNVDADPCFVRLGSWQEVTYTRPIRDGGSSETINILIEGDYHLRSQGWRWSTQEVHGSHWYFDLTTSPAVDSGDPMDALGEELERAPDDPEGRWGFNRAIDRGAYGGTTQASLSPTVGEVAGIGALDLLDYWPFGVTARAGGTGASQWYIHDSQGIARQFYVTGMNGQFGAGAQHVAYHVSTANAADWVAKVNCYYGNRALYITEGTPKINPPQAPEQIQAEYPEFLVPDTTIQAPYDPFTKTPVEYRSVLVVRGALAEVLDGTTVDPAQFLPGEWPDVIALKEIGADATAGDPIAIFARGFGPLMIAGRPITGAVINSREFGNTAAGGVRIR
jgi:hypothetical protein